MDGGRRYLSWMGERVPTSDRGRGDLPWMGGGGYLPLMGGGGTYLAWGRKYLPWMGEDVPTLDGGRGTYLK